MRMRAVRQGTATGAVLSCCRSVDVAATPVLPRMFLLRSSGIDHTPCAPAALLPQSHRATESHKGAQ